MNNKIALLTLIFYLLYPANIAWSEEAVDIKFEALPDAVKKTVLNYVEKQFITKITKITDKGHIKFKVEADKNENKMDTIAQDIVIADNGKVMQSNREVPYFTLSFEQMQEIEKRYPDIKVDEVESVEIHYLDVLGKMNGQPIQLRIFENNAIEEISPDQKPAVAQ